MTLKYMLDTNVCIYIAKNQPKSVLRKFEKLKVGQVAMSTVTYGELLYGGFKSKYTKNTQALIKKLAELIPPLAIPADTGEYYGEIRSMLEKKGKPIGNNDLWIVAHAMALDVTLVTNNVKEFSRLKALKLENWVD